MNSFNDINDPLTNKKYSIYSEKGRELLKNYIKQYKKGVTVSYSYLKLLYKTSPSIFISKD